MKSVDGWVWPDREKHLIAWMAHPKNRMMLNGRAAYQGKKQLAALAAVARYKGPMLRTAIDVGGHVGLWSYNLAPAFQHVHAFEPVDYLRECFERNMDEQTVNVTLHPVALGAVEGSVSMHTTVDSTGDSWVKGAGEIPMHTLDRFDLGPVDFIKIDVEGYEENVLRGAECTIVRDRPVICVEQKRDMASRFGLQPLGAVKFLQSLGYRVEQEIGGDFLMVAA
jgi:FkbM family methyltransferase